jgi:hypothetical protein
MATSCGALPRLLRLPARGRFREPSGRRVLGWPGAGAGRRRLTAARLPQHRRRNRFRDPRTDRSAGAGQAARNQVSSSAAKPNVALQPTCGARLWRGGELRRRRMRLNFGVRLRQQSCRREHRSHLGSRYLRQDLLQLSYASESTAAYSDHLSTAADKRLNSNTAPPKLLVTADWRPRISAARATTAALPQHLMEPPTSC